MIKDYYIPLYFIERKMVEDEYGGYTEEFQRGLEFQGYITHSRNVNVLVAEQQGVTSTYKLYTAKELPLKVGDIIQRSDNSKYIRVTGDGSENRTPDSAGIDMQVVTAESWVLPT